MENTIKFHINGEKHEVTSTKGDMLLINYLHENETQRFSGTKLGCGIGACAACKVILQEEKCSSYIPVLSCYARLNALGGMYITTVEGIGEDNTLNDIQETFNAKFAFQCGYCTPGYIVTSEILKNNLRQHPCTKEELDQKILDSIQGHLCRCTGYTRYFEAIKEVINTDQYIQTDNPIVDTSVPNIYFKLTKQSSNDNEEKTLTGNIENIDYKIQFDDIDDIFTMKSNFKFFIREIRTGERIRDINLITFLFSKDKESYFEFQMTGIKVFDATKTNKLQFNKPLLVSVNGNLCYKKVSIPITSDFHLNLLEANMLSITSISPTNINLVDFKLPIVSFAQVFGLKLGNQISVYISGVFNYSISNGM